MSEYPKVKYKTDAEPKLVVDDKSEKALGSEWGDSPAEDSPSAEPKKETKQG